MKFLTAIVLAAGIGARIKSKIPKPLLKINSKPIIIYSLKALDNHPFVGDIIVSVNKNNAQGIRQKVRQYGIKKISAFVYGGLRRQDSVKRSLKALNKNTKLVLIHDGGRPFIDKEAITRVAREAERVGAAIVGVPVKNTIKKIQNPCLAGKQAKSKIRTKFVEETLRRDQLWEIQTPQVFRRDLIQSAYAKFGNTDVTDDAGLVEKLGAKVSIVMGSYSNIKITTPEDLIIAESILESQKSKVKSNNL